MHCAVQSKSTGLTIRSSRARFAVSARLETSGQRAGLTQALALTVKISSLRSKARRNTLEVEHILAAAKARTPGLKDELNSLAREFEWSNTTHLPDGKHVVPLAKWAEVSGKYAEGGISALADLAREPDNANYVIGLLEELRSRDATEALISFFPDVLRQPETSITTAWRLSRAFNQLLSIKGAVTPTDRQAIAVRSFLVLFHAAAATEPERAWAIYALRGVGDQSSLDFLSKLPDLQPP